MKSLSADQKEIFLQYEFGYHAGSMVGGYGPHMGGFGPGPMMNGGHGCGW